MGVKDFGAGTLPSPGLKLFRFETPPAACTMGGFAGATRILGYSGIPTVPGFHDTRPPIGW